MTTSNPSGVVGIMPLARVDGVGENIDDDRGGSIKPVV